ncbi:MAG: hypothetical protein N3E37_00465 [Candidatus Micrarchaeota archaeon]|nr:hypothetical protein [Candidatus Micrarchaeota archaeon]
MTKKSYRCPTKLILIGEHFAVYGKKAIAMPVKPYNYLTIDDFYELKIVINNQQITLDHKAYYFLPVINHIKNKTGGEVKKFFNFLMNGFKGMGNSASLSALFSYATLKEYEIFEEKEFKNLAFECENLAHGKKASGIDLQTVLSQKPIIYQKLHNKKLFEEVDISLPSDFSLLAISTLNVNEKTDSTSKMIKKFSDAYGAVINSICDDYQNLFDEFISALEDKDIYSMANIMNKVHELLKPVTTKKIEFIRNDLLALGALGVKISGAGGTGSVIICLTENNSLNRIVDYLKSKKLRFMNVEILNSNKGVEQINEIYFENEIR